MWRALFFLLLLPSVAFAQNPPAGQLVLNQGLNAVAVSNGVNIPPTRAIFNGNSSACNIEAVMSQGNLAGAVVFQNVQVGQILPISVTQIVAASTTCTNLIALY